MTDIILYILFKVGGAMDTTGGIHHAAQEGRVNFRELGLLNNGLYLLPWQHTEMS